MYEHIHDALRRGANVEALDAARTAVAAEPEDARAHQLLSEALRALGDRAGALACLERALELTPDEAALHLERADLLLGEQRLDEAQAALARSTGLDPNQFGAYVLKAQLALGRGDLDDADAQRKLAARIAPGHPRLDAIEGVVALRRGDSAHALSVLSAATRRAPDDMQLRYALGFAYFEQGHYAFAEQAFRGVLERTGDAMRLRALIADALRLQGRHDEALRELQPLLADRERVPPGLRRIAGQLELAAGRSVQGEALLREALLAQPRDSRTLTALVDAWRRTDNRVVARETLERALEQAPDFDRLWQARIALEQTAGPESRAVLARWLHASPQSIGALEAQMNLHAADGDEGAAGEIARRILALEPARTSAQWQLLRALMSRDPDAAVAHAAQLLQGAGSSDSRHFLRGWLALALDRAARYPEAVVEWRALHDDVSSRLLALPVLTALQVALSPQATSPAHPDVVLLIGAPGSRVEQVATLLRGTTGVFREDRFGPRPPQDLFQDTASAAKLRDGAIRPADAFASWRDALPARGIEGALIDWLPWWDNGWLSVLRTHLPHARLLFALRDPRDMLLDWLAFDVQLSFALRSPQAAAHWLRIELEHIASVHAEHLQPHTLLRLDSIADAPELLAQAVGGALQTTLPPPPRVLLGPPHFTAGHWRAYRDVLADEFAQLTAIAVQLGYPES